MRVLILKYKLLFILLFFTLKIAAQDADTNSETNQVQFDTISEILKLQNLANTALISQDYKTAIGDLILAQTYSEKIKNNEYTAAIYTDFGKLFYTLKYYNKAAFEVNKAIDILKESDKSPKLASAYIQYGKIFTMTNEYNKANLYFDKAHTIFNSLNDESSLAKLKLYKGNLALMQNNETSAINYFDAALPTFEKLELPYYAALTLINKSKAFLKLESVEEEEITKNILLAEESFQKAFLLANENSFLNIKTESIYVESLISSRRKEFDKAYTLLKQYNTQKISLEHIGREVFAQDTAQKMGNGDYEKTIEELNKKLEEKESSLNMNRFTTTLSIALITILSLLTLSLYKNNNLRAKANNLLQDKNSELQLAKEKAEKASLAKAQFLSTITHELRTPLYAVTGLTHLLLEENPLEHQKEHLNSLKFSGDYLLSLINNILDLNKLEANKVEVEKTTFHLKKRINDVLIALKKSASDKNNKLILEFDDSIPNKLLGDPLKISQILINLIGNSVKFTENGYVTLRVQKISEKGETILLHFEIEDNGVGISAKKQKSIFETFSQGSLQINRKFGGTGLGLSIVKNLLQLMHSKIHLESTLGKGSKFMFDIKFDVSNQFKEDTNSHNIVYDVDYSALENLKVLVVEDNKINQMITKKILEKNKMVCDVADNGEIAVALVKENKYNLILMDIHMPGISGIEATQQIREFNKDIPIIALTAVTIDENLDDFYRAGFNEIIPKPFKTEDFFEKIHHTLFVNKTNV